MKITRKKAMEYNIVLNMLASFEATIRFQYTLRKNLNVLEDEMKIIQEIKEKITTPSPEIEEYEKKRITLCEEYCDKNEDNSPKKIGSGREEQFVFSHDNKIILDSKMQELMEEYKEVLDKEIEEEKEFFNFIEEEIDVNLIKLKLSEMPLDKTIEQKYINAIFDLIEEE